VRFGHIKNLQPTNSGVTRGLGQGGKLGKSMAQLLLKYEKIGRNFNDAEKSEQCSNVTRKLIESNKLGGGLGAEPLAAGGRSPQRCGNFSSFLQK